MLRFRSPVFLAASLAACVAVLCGPGPASADSPCGTALRANTRANSYAASMVMHPPGRPTLTMTFEVQKPGSIHTIERGASSSEVIAIDSKTWIRQGGGSWQMLPQKMDMRGVLSMDPMQFTDAKEISCTDGGMGVMHGAPAHVYKTSYVILGGRQSGTLYVSSDGYLVHMDGDGAKGPSTADFTRFNQVTISPP